MKTVLLFVRKLRFGAEVWRHVVHLRRSLRNWPPIRIVGQKKEEPNKEGGGAYDDLSNGHKSSKKKEFSAFLVLLDTLTSDHFEIKFICDQLRE